MTADLFGLVPPLELLIPGLLELNIVVLLGVEEDADGRLWQVEVVVN